jgi:hypothetical protein
MGADPEFTPSRQLNQEAGSPSWPNGPILIPPGHPAVTGYMFRIRVWNDADRSGNTFEMVNEDCPYVGDNFNDQISCVEIFPPVDRNGNPVPYFPGNPVWPPFSVPWLFYVDANYGQPALSLGIGYYPNLGALDQLPGLPLPTMKDWNDKVSSIRMGSQA